MAFRPLRRLFLSALVFVVFGVVFVVPFAFIVVNAGKTADEAAMRSFALPERWHLVDNFLAVISARDHMLLTAYVNSIIITVASVALLVVLSAMVGFVLARRPDGWARVAGFFILFGLVMPPAVVPTIWLLQGIGLFKTLQGLVLIQVAYALSFCVLLFRAFVSNIPRELDEAAVIDGAGPLSVFFRVIFPLLRPVILTVTIIQSVLIFNDFTHPLYYLPGKQNVTVQLTIYNFISDYATDYNLLFMNILLITIPTLIVFVFFNRRIVAGMTAGAVKG